MRGLNATNLFTAEASISPPACHFRSCQDIFRLSLPKSAPRLRRSLRWVRLPVSARWNRYALRSCRWAVLKVSGLFGHRFILIQVNYHSLLSEIPVVVIVHRNDAEREWQIPKSLVPIGGVLVSTPNR